MIISTSPPSDKVPEFIVFSVTISLTWDFCFSAKPASLQQALQPAEALLRKIFFRRPHPLSPEEREPMKLRVR